MILFNSLFDKIDPWVRVFCLYVRCRETLSNRSSTQERQFKAAPKKSIGHGITNNNKTKTIKKKDNTIIKIQ